MRKFSFILIVLAQLFNYMSAAANVDVQGNAKVPAQHAGISNAPNQSEDPANLTYAFNIINPGIRSGDQQWSSDVAVSANHVGFNRFLIHKACTTSASFHSNSYMRILLYPNHFFW